MKNNLRIILFLALLINKVEAATNLVLSYNLANTELRNFSGNFLTAGDLNRANDGAILQLGYYTMASELAPFEGAWVPLTGEGSGNYRSSTIGDKAMGNGLFALESKFFTTDTDLPTGSLPLTIRFYDATSLGSSTYFNAVSNTSGAWNWVTPSNLNPRLTISLADSGLIWQDGASSAFRTTIPIPEPTTVILFLGGAAIGLRRRRTVNL
jgi:PEP-CTERM motif